MLDIILFVVKQTSMVLVTLAPNQVLKVLVVIVFEWDTPVLLLLSFTSQIMLLHFSMMNKDAHAHFYIPREDNEGQTVVGFYEKSIGHVSSRNYP